MQLELKISADKVEKSCTNPDLKKQRVKSRRSGRCVVYLLNVISWIAAVKLYRNTNWTVILVWLMWQLKEVYVPSICCMCKLSLIRTGSGNCEHLSKPIYLLHH